MILSIASGVYTPPRADRDDDKLYRLHFLGGNFPSDLGDCSAPPLLWSQ